MLICSSVNITSSDYYYDLEMRYYVDPTNTSTFLYVPEFYHYLAKLHAYRRRLNTEIPNFTRKQITFEYYRITFYKIIHFFLNLYSKLKIRDIVKKLLKRYTLLHIDNLFFRFFKLLYT